MDQAEGAAYAYPEGGVILASFALMKALLPLLLLVGVPAFAQVMPHAFLATGPATVITAQQETYYPRGAASFQGGIGASADMGRGWLLGGDLGYAYTLHNLSADRTVSTQAEHAVVLRTWVERKLFGDFFVAAGSFRQVVVNDPPMERFAHGGHIGAGIDIGALRASLLYQQSFAAVDTPKGVALPGAVMVMMAVRPWVK